MLTDLTKMIEKALMSYMKGQEGANLRDQYAQGLLGMIIQCRHVTHDRKQDIQAIFAICQEAEKHHEEPRVCIERIVNHLNQMATGFLFFRGQSKLKTSLINAINIYDPRYILDSTTHPIVLDEEAMDRELQVRLVPTSFPALPSRAQDNGIQPEVQRLIDGLKEEMATLKLSIRTHKQSLKMSNDSNTEKDQEIVDLKTEIIDLKGQLARLQGKAPVGPASQRGSINAESTEEDEAYRQAGFTY